MNATIAKDRDTITVHVPLTFRKRGGRKQVVTPQGVAWTAPAPASTTPWSKPSPVVSAGADFLETGVYATIDDLAATEKINASSRQPIAAPHLAFADPRGGDPQWAAVGGHHARLPLETVPGRMGQAEQVVEAIEGKTALLVADPPAETRGGIVIQMRSLWAHLRGESRPIVGASPQFGPELPRYGYRNADIDCSAPDPAPAPDDLVAGPCFLTSYWRLMSAWAVPSPIHTALAEFRPSWSLLRCIPIRSGSSCRTP